MFLQGYKVFCAEAEEPVDTKAEGGGDYSLTDTGADVTLDSPEKSDEDSGDKSPDEAGSEKEAPDDAADDGEVTPESISDELLDRAIDLGFAASDIIKYRSLSSLTAAIEQAEATKARLDALEARKSKPKAEEQEEDEFEKMLEDGYDERTVKALKAADERAKAADARAKSLEEQIQSDRAERARQARQSQFDSVLKMMASEYPETFGEGTADDLDQKSQEFKNRAEVWQRYHVMEAGYQAAGLKVPPAEKLIREAAAAAFSQKTQEIARKKLKDDFKRAGSQTVARSRPAGSRPLDGEEAAIAKTREFLRKNA